MITRRPALARLALLLALPAAAAVISACGGGDDSLDDRLGIADPKVRLVHAVPGAPNVSLFRDDIAQSAEVTNMPYKGASNYFDVSSSSARWDVRTATTPTVTVGTSTFDANRGNRYTLLAVPSSASLTEVALIVDPFNKSVVSDNARVRVFNASFNATTALDFYVTAPNADISAVAPTFSGVGFKQALPASGTNSVEFEGGARQLRITRAGTKNVIFNAPINLAADADWLIVTLPDSATLDDVRVLAVQSDSGTPATEILSQ